MGDSKPLEMTSRGRSQKVRELDTDYQPVNWKRVFLAPKYLACWIITIIAIVLTILLTVYHDQVVELSSAAWYTGYGSGSESWPRGHSLASYLVRRKAEKLERTNLNYGALARLTRDGSFWIVLLIRFSAIPSHFSTAVFATCGVNFWAFAIATLLTLPKQIFLVYLGVLLVQDHADNSAKNIVFAVAFVATLAMAVYIWWKMRKIKRVLLEEQAARRKARVVGGDVVGDEGEGREWLMEGRVVASPQGAREYEVVAQEEADIGMVGAGRDGTPEQQGPYYRTEFQYHGAGGRGDVGREPVREQAWV
ncbi:hypothetical protein CHGG_00096 [Chaetomium globosum CBS 148.51]|uniref:Golgi apparatus membrane protein TVP38 n=1 Tax=Chaetomium globosum (strain ATCC 6205 / CBS 148.51 / DSM 1962 / NBRC 6347 / NRRL 1970) TaxID=306901 RepID=Q2HI58_CHAGB|nr:uncharacterized protein CHGG_00096 [Chaetomium globosum CBS 148.51]EAQ91861.1 hypothetical protein CHGG_00096 [Chaetomium globosum CBS 148.51]